MDIEIKKPERPSLIMRLRWQDWANILLGVWLLFSPWIMGLTMYEVASTNARTLGMLIIFFNLMIACRTIDQGQEIINIIFGIWLVLSPYMLGFQDETAFATNIIGAGVLIIGLAIWEMFSSARGSR